MQLALSKFVLACRNLLCTTMVISIFEVLHSLPYSQVEVTWHFEVICLLDFRVFLLPTSCCFLRLLTLQPWRWRRHITLEGPLIFIRLHDLISQKTKFFISPLWESPILKQYDCFTSQYILKQSNEIIVYLSALWFFNLLHDKCFFLFKYINEHAINEIQMQFSSSTALTL
jgi:hypothetical protein